jgi:Icc-related predicted phosphoesterase
LVPGNHDDYIEAHPEVAQGDGIELLWDRGITVEGLKLYGSPFRVVPEERMQKQSIRWSAFMITETWAELVWREIPDGLDILITHQPCYGIADYALKQRWGSHALLAAVNRARPKVHIFGHVHSSASVIDKGPHETKRINAAQCGDDHVYWLQWRPIAFDLSPRDEQQAIDGV